MKKRFSLMLKLLILALWLSLTACHIPPTGDTATQTTTQTTTLTETASDTTAPITEAVTAPTTEPATEPLPLFTRREHTTMLEGISVDTWLLTDDAVYIRLEDFLSAAGISEDALPETEILVDAEGFSYIPLYAVVESLNYPLWEDTQFSTTYITPSAAAFTLPEGIQVPILMYHALGDDLWGEPELFVRAEDMEAQLQYLLDNGYDPIWFSDLRNIEKYDKPVILTFDDGYDDNYTILLPLLQKYNVKATVFVVAGLTEQPHKMSWGEVKTMSQSGLVSIQSHGMYHADLSKLNAEELIFELGDSRLSITRMSGKIPSVICYPSGKFSDLTLEIAERYYHFGVQMGNNDIPGNDPAHSMYITGNDPYTVYRHYISRYTTLEEFALYVAGAGEPA